MIKRTKTPKKYDDYRTLNPISHAGKIILRIRILYRKLYEKLNERIGEEQYGFGREAGIRDAIGLLRVVGERNINIKRKVCDICRFREGI